MLPIQAFEPAMTLQLGMGISCLCLLGLRWFQGPRDVRSPQHWRSLLQFRLLDLVLATTMIGLILGSSLYLLAEMPDPDPQEEPTTILYPALTLIVLTILCWCTVQGPLGNWATGLLVASLPWLTWLLWPETTWLYELDSDLIGALGYLAGHDNLDGYAATFLGLVLYSAFVITASLSVAHSRRSGALGASIRFVGVSIACAAALSLAAFYVAMLGRSPFPPTVQTDANNYVQIMQIAKRVKQLNESEQPIGFWQSNDPTIADELSALYGELTLLSDQAGSLPYDLSIEKDRQEHDKTMTDRIAALSTLCDSLEVEAKSTGDRGEHSRAIELALANVRIGQMLSKNGVLIDGVIGYSIQSRGERPLYCFRHHVADDLCRQVIESLARIEENAEPVETMLEREIAYCQYMYGWQTRFGHLVGWLVVGPPDTWEPYKHSHAVQQRRTAIRRLLLTEFAIRRYRLAGDKLPASLKDLEPYLPAPLLDPFSGRPFIYHRQGDAFMLYSVGSDQQDDGGRFGTLKIAVDVRGYDLDAETLIRGEAMYAAP